MVFKDSLLDKTHAVEDSGDVRHADDLGPRTLETSVDDEYRYAEDIDDGIERSQLFKDAVAKIEAAIETAAKGGYQTVKVDGLTVAKYIIDLRVHKELSVAEFNRLVELYCSMDLEIAKRTLGSAAATSAAKAWSPSASLGANVRPTIIDHAMLAANDRPDRED